MCISIQLGEFDLEHLEGDIRGDDRSLIGEYNPVKPEDEDYT